MSRGAPTKIDGVPGVVQEFEGNNFSIIYTTPFTSAEFYIYPSKSSYGIDIWHNHRKVISEVFTSTEEFSPKQHIRAAWAREFMEL